MTTLVKKNIENIITIDIAALCMEYTKIEKMCDHQIIDLDDIYINKNRFKKLYYPQGETFALDKKIACQEEMIPFISFQHEHRTVKGEKFNLLESIIRSLENTMNASRHCFTSDTMVELTNELGTLKSLCDIPCCSVLASLPWSTLEDTMNTHKSLNTDNKEPIFHCRLSIYFKSPSVSEPIVVRFNYVIVDLHNASSN
jgi:hypothetical protein